ncbi:MAG: 7-cyano-7-deazaguanine synthase QueC [Dehalococcoidia bacterium]|nr:7-cyano-7-deazaguanine synthase QueC [Dehalococcoidia bacterium]
MAASEHPAAHSPTAEAGGRYAVVLLSGGLDSATAAAHALHEGYTLRALTIGYSQLHARELAAARAVAGRLGVPHVEVDLSGYGALASYSALTDPVAFALPAHRPLGDMAAAIPITYVPLRNTFLVTLAAAALESWMLALIEEKGVDPGRLRPAVFVGANAIDYSGYPDCRPEYHAALAGVLRLGSKLGADYGVPIAVEAPLLAMGKAEIVRYGLALGAPLELTWSCYAGGERPCGACDSCRLRAAGFAAAGVADPACGAP